jgi:hemolysin D
MLHMLGRYRAVFRAAWDGRAELQGPRRLTEEVAFLPAALSLQESPVHPAPRRAACLIIGLFILALLWSVIGEVDIVAVAHGRIIVVERTKMIQPLERSIVRRVLVKDGDRVEAGQHLVELDPTVAGADSVGLAETQKAIESEVSRVRGLIQVLAGHGPTPRVSFARSWTRAERSIAEAQLAAEWREITAKLEKLASEIKRRQAESATARAVTAKLEATLPMSQQRELDASRLADQGFMPVHAAQDRLRERIELERELVAQRARLAETEAAVKESEDSHASYVAEVRRVLQDREAQASLKAQQITQEQAKATYRQRLTSLTAPVDGIVQQLAVHTPGGVVTEAQTLMVIVPDSAAVTAEVVIENKDVGFVQVPQPAEIKLETFPYTRYGTVPAVVSRVTADAVADEKRGALFPATLTLLVPHIEIGGRAVRLSPGMNVTAEIKTGKRRVIEFLLSPVQRAGRESLRER